MGTGSPPVKSCLKESLRECAGSVEIIKVICLLLAKVVAIDAEILDFPTPPLPPTSKKRRLVLLSNNFNDITITSFDKIK